MSKPRLRVLALVAGGGSWGTAARYAIGLAFPYEHPANVRATLTVNLVGAFALGILVGWAELMQAASRAGS